MQYDNHGATRRLVLRGAACLGLFGAYRTVVATPAHTPGSGSAPARAAGSRPAGDSYRFRPLSGTGPLPAAARPHGPARLRGGPHLTLGDVGRAVALTFDDGPHPVHTPAVLRILRRHGVRATFFVIGENAEWNPDLVKAIAEDGHLVANHSWSHPQLDLVPVRRVRGELGRTSELIDRSLGAPPRYARAPYGAWHGPSLRVCAELGMEPMGWSLDTLDWKEPGSRTIRSRVLDGVRPGTVVLAHDGGGDRGQTVDALARYLPRLLDRGYTVVPLAPPG